MGNLRYNAGRRMEWERKKVWETVSDAVLRTAGSHGFADLISVTAHCPPHFIQCKRTKTEAQATRMLRAFEKNPPLPMSSAYVLVLEVWVPRKGVFSTSVHGGDDD